MIYLKKCICLRHFHAIVHRHSANEYIISFYTEIVYDLKSDLAAFHADNLRKIDMITQYTEPSHIDLLDIQKHVQMWALKNIVLIDDRSFNSNLTSLVIDGYKKHPLSYHISYM